MATRRVIGVDIDGVLADQVSGVLARVNARDRSSHVYSDIVDWNFKFADSDFLTEIRAAQADPTYMLEMPVHPGAAAMLDALCNSYTVKLLTVRPPEALPWTTEWLARNGLRYDELVPAEEALKSRHGTDALIDDYDGNIAEFLGNDTGPAILVDQPWNQHVPLLDPWLGSDRLTRVVRLADVLTALATALR